MKTRTAFAATLAAGMALAPMATGAATIGIAGGGGLISGNGESVGGSFGINFVTGVNTPRNEGESRVCDPSAYPSASGIVCSLGFGTNNVVISEDVTNTTLLTGTFVEPVTANIGGIGYPFEVSVSGALKDVVIDEDLAAYYGVPNRGTGQFNAAGGGRYANLDFPEQGFYVLFPQGGVTFSPVPVPAALPLMLTALAGLGLIRLRRTQTA